MTVIGIVLVAAGIVAIIVAALQIRGPLGRIRQLDQTEANLARYESWRGKKVGVEADGPTGADIMRQQMRKQVMLWGGLAGVGVASIVIGLVIG